MACVVFDSDGRYKIDGEGEDVESENEGNCPFEYGSNIELLFEITCAEYY
jgi:hypothetical protein